MKLDKKQAIITGGNQGFGLEIAKNYIQAGADIMICGRNKVLLEKAQVELMSTASPNQKVAISVADVSNEDDVNQLVSETISTLGGCQILVNNAGILRDAIFHKMTEEDWDQVVSVHLKGAFSVSRAAADVFRAQESGRMIHMTSTSGLIGNFGQANYAAAKLGIAALSKSIALDMARYNVTSNAIAPFAWSRLIGTIPITNEAERVRIERMKQMTPAKIAPVIVALSADAAQHVSGQIFAVRGSEVMLMGQSRPLRSMARPDGWTAETVLEHVFPAMETAFYDLDRSGDIFTWDPV